MKPFLFIFFSLLFTGSSLAMPIKLAMPERSLSKGKEQVFDFIFKLDSMNYHSGKVDLKSKLVNRFNKSKREKVHARYKQLSDSVYSVRIKGDAYLLNTKSGQVIDSKNGYLIYQPLRLKILNLTADTKLTNASGIDSLGSFTTYFDNSWGWRDLVYDPQPLSSNKTIQYKIRYMPFVNENDSSWVETDTTRIIRQYDNNKLISERTQRMSAYHFPEIVEYQYSMSGDTTIQMLTHFEDGYGGEYPSGIYMTISPSLLVKKVYVLYENKSHQYEYIDSKTTISTEVTDKSWKFTEFDGIFYSQIFRQVSYKEHFDPFQVTENTRIHFSGKK